MKKIIDLDKFKKIKEEQEFEKAEEHFEMMMEEISYLAHEILNIMHMLGIKKVNIDFNGDLKVNFMEDDEYEEAYKQRNESEDSGTEE